jgi:hypothetical protein
MWKHNFLLQNLGGSYSTDLWPEDIFEIESCFRRNMVIYNFDYGGASIKYESNRDFEIFDPPFLFETSKRVDYLFYQSNFRLIGSPRQGSRIQDLFSTNIIHEHVPTYSNSVMKKTLKHLLKQN